jgi:hypothetical protein
VAGQEGSIVVLRESAHMGFGDGKSCGDRGGNLMESRAEIAVGISL